MRYDTSEWTRVYIDICERVTVFFFIKQNVILCDDWFVLTLSENWNKRNKWYIWCLFINLQSNLWHKTTSRDHKMWSSMTGGLINNVTSLVHKNGLVSQEWSPRRVVPAQVFWLFKIYRYQQKWSSQNLKLKSGNKIAHNLM